MEVKQKLVVAFAIFALMIVSVIVIQWTFLSQDPNLSAPTSYALDETFTAQSFLYGPQAWAPYYSKMPIVPDGDVNGETTYHLLFVDLNATSNLDATFPCVRVDYEFSGLQGTAAFHIYGYIHENDGISWTNRVDGSGANGYYVTASASSGKASAVQNAQVLPDSTNVNVKVSNQAGATYDDFGDETYYMKFEKDGGGLNSMHITTDPSNPTGDVTTTEDLEGTFYVNFTGSRVQDNFVLLVAVDGAITEDFALHLQSSIPD
ncbi:MAG: hypothetical protein NWF04_05185 [Candidatus Bathyarchaeota archaeon]|nr:hypothetical protein [Candidatus Bathyarchaeota archaeon]